MNIKSSLVICSVLAVSAFAVAAGGDIFLQANLTGTGKGKAVWKTRDRNTQLQAELSGEGERLPRNTTLAIKVGNTGPFLVKTDAFGTYRYSFRYIGQHPTMNAGDQVLVVAPGNVLLQSGVLAK